MPCQPQPPFPHAKLESSLGGFRTDSEEMNKNETFGPESAMSEPVASNAKISSSSKFSKIPLSPHEKSLTLQIYVSFSFFPRPHFHAYEVLVQAKSKASSSSFQWLCYCPPFVQKLSNSITHYWVLALEAHAG